MTWWQDAEVTAMKGQKSYDKRYKNVRSVSVSCQMSLALGPGSNIFFLSHNSESAV